MTRGRALLRGITSLVGLAVLLLGLPWALRHWGQLPTVSTDGWWQNLSRNTVSDATVFVALTLAAWAIWALFITSVILEVLAAVRGVNPPHLGFAGPVQRTARGLVLGVVLMTSLVGHDRPALAAPGSPTAIPLPKLAEKPIVEATLPANSPGAHADPIGEAIGATVGSTVTPSAADNGSAALTEVVVERGDNPWTLAETHLGEGMRWRELWDLNQGLPQSDGRAWTDPEIILPGWHLRLSPDTRTSDTGATAPSAGQSTVHVVEPGDSLSRLAERYLGDSGRYPELLDANRDTVQTDGRRLVDPDIVVVGWHLVIPMDPAPTTDGKLAPPPPDEPTASATENLPAPTEPDAAAEPLPVPVPTTPTTALALPATDAPTTASPSAGRSTTTSPAPAGEGTSAPPEKGPLAPIAAGISGAVVLATGLALRFRWLRHRRATRGAGGHRVATRTVERAALTAADVPLVRWAGQHLAILVQVLDGRRLNAGPVAVELSEQTGLEILWDTPQHAPVPGEWTAADGGWAWRLAYHPEAPVPADELTAGIPALVTIGRRDDRELLIDLEAFGVLTVAGPEELIAQFIRSVTLELACGNDLSDAYVTAVGLDLDPAIAPRHRLTTSNTVAALAHLEAAHRSVGEVLEHDGAPDTFRARAGARAPIDVTVVVARDLDPADLERLTQAAGPRHGVAVVATGPPAGPHGAHVQIDQTGTTAQLDPLGITFQPVGMPTTTSEAIDAAVAELVELPDDTVEPPLSATSVQHNGRRDVDAPVEPLSEAITLHDGPTGNGERPADIRSSVQDARAINAADVSDLRAGDPSLDDVQGVGGDGPFGARFFTAHRTPTQDVTRLVVRVLGVPGIPERPSIGRRELILAVLLACRNGTLAASAAQDALWGGKPVEAKTVWNFVANARRALGEFADGSPVMPAAGRTHGTLHLDPRVTTDLAMLREVVAQAPEMSSAEATAALRSGLALVDGPPFDAPGYDWAHRDQDVAEAAAIIEQAVDRLVTLAVEAGQIEIAREAITRGLRGLPGDEHCYRARMGVEAAAGNHAGIVAAYEELTVYLADFDTEPSPATTALYRELIRQPRARASSIR